MQNSSSDSLFYKNIQQCLLPRNQKLEESAESLQSPKRGTTIQVSRSTFCTEKKKKKIVRGSTIQVTCSIFSREKQ